MKILMYDQFIDSILKLPREAQKKVRDFMTKLRENPESPALHLEPISTFRDPQLRTARLDKKYRVIVRVPEEGDRFLLLWADNHDEAMDWAKNRIIRWNEKTRAFQVFMAPEEEDTPAPAQADKAVGPSPGYLEAYSDDELLQIGVPEALLPSVRNMKNLNDLEALERYLPLDAFENLFALSDGQDIQQLIFEVSQGRGSEADIEAQQSSANEQRSFFEWTGDEQLDQMLAGTLKKWKIYLHPTQRLLVEGNFKGSVKVSGGAGTGKTVAALHRLKYLLNNDLGREGKHILFTTFTKSLTSNLAHDLRDWGIDQTRVQLQNIDAFAVDRAKKLELVSPQVRILNYPGFKKSMDIWEEVLDFELSEFDSEFLDAEYQEVILYNHLRSATEYYRCSRIGRGSRLSRKQRMQVWALVERYEALKQAQNYVDRNELFNRLYEHHRDLADKPYGHVLADELQDFSNVELRLLRALVREKPNDLFLVGDPLQNIYDRKLNFSKVGIQIRGRRSVRLRVNYRTTEEIRREAVATIKGITFDNFDGGEEDPKGYVSFRHGQRPEYQLFKSKEEEIAFVLQKLAEYTDPDREDAVRYEDICIAARVSNSLKSFRSQLHQSHIPHFDISGDTGLGDREQGVRLSTFHSIKGLEFKVVFLVDVHERSLPYQPHSWQSWQEHRKEQHLRSERALAYVAMTRAIHMVHITGAGNRSEVFG